MQKECILLNKIFEGSYTDNISNIPHEIIDFFKADDGKNHREKHHLRRTKVG